VGSASRESAQHARILPGTPMRKVIPPRMVGPYMSGQRGVIAGYVALAGWLVLGETLTARAVFGCVLMLIGLIVCQVLPIWHARRQSASVG